MELFGIRLEDSAQAAGVVMKQLLEHSGGFVPQLQLRGIVAAVSATNGAWKIKKEKRRWAWIAIGILSIIRQLENQRNYRGFKGIFRQKIAILQLQKHIPSTTIIILV